MRLKELLQTLGKVAEENGINKPYIVGGVPRNILLGNFQDINDLDITTGSEDINELADKFGEVIGEEVRDLGEHKQITHEDIVIDFSSNFKYENIDDLLERAGVDEINDLVRETYSRDFTVNTLLIPMDFSSILDLTGRGKKDVEAGILKCPLNCNISFKASPNRMIRAFAYKSKYDFDVPQEMIEAIKDNVEILREVDVKYAKKQMNAILREKPEMLEELLELGVLQKIPLTKEIVKQLINKKRILDIL